MPRFLTIDRPIRIRRRTWGVVGLFCLLMFAGWVIPRVGWSDGVDRGSVTSGGTVDGKSATHRISGAIGQVAVGQSLSSSHSVESGIWNGLTCDCRYHGDTDANGVIDIFDVVAIVEVAFRGGSGLVVDPHCPHLNRGDVDCDNLIDVFDVVIEVTAAFRGDDTRCTPCNN